MVGCKDICCKRDVVLDFYASLKPGNPILPTQEHLEIQMNYALLYGPGNDPGFGLVKWCLACGF